MRPYHALEGKVLEVFAKLRHKGKPHFMLVLPDGSRSYHYSDICHLRPTQRPISLIGAIEWCWAGDN